ncbi:MAG: hypothetical protein LBH44_00420 [Treponema sp.]|jgi:hypothetical protein|nr:hypothetical protein [Treponema sp.]
MKKKTSIVLFLYLFCVIHLFAELRAFNDIFPNMSEDVRKAVFRTSGYVQSGQTGKGFALVSNDYYNGLDSQIVNMVLNKKPVYIAESIQVIPGEPGAISLLNVYNAMGNINGLKGILYRSATKKQNVPLFEEATRIISEKNTSAIPDPAPAAAVPRAETVYIRLKDANFGNTYYRLEITRIQNGLRYNLTNFKSFSYLLIPVIKEGKFIAQLYFEPIAEGVLIYSIAGTDLSDFFASKIDMESAIAKRLAGIVSWAVNGINKIKG